MGDGEINRINGDHAGADGVRFAQLLTHDGGWGVGLLEHDCAGMERLHRHTLLLSRWVVDSRVLALAVCGARGLCGDAPTRVTRTSQS